MKEHHYKYLTISTYVNCTFILEFDRIREKEERKYGMCVLYQTWTDYMEC